MADGDRVLFPNGIWIPSLLHGSIGTLLHMGATILLVIAVLYQHWPRPATIDVIPLAPPSQADRSALAPLPPIASPQVQVQVKATPLGPTLLFFTDPIACEPCKRVAPEVAKLVAAGYPVREIDVRTESSRGYRDRYGFRATPTFIVVDGAGNEVGRTEGYQTGQALSLFYKASIAKIRTASASPATLPWESVVRISFPDGKFTSVGSGTVIDSTLERSIILSCAHIVPGKSRRQSVATGSVETFDGVLVGSRVTATGDTYECSVIDVDRGRDVSLLLIKPGKILPVSRVASGPTLAIGTRLRTAGCSHGKDATAWDSQVVAVGIQMRGMAGYQGTECAGLPAQGRSGGGLYRGDTGEVTGVANFAQDRSGTGIYASPASIHHILDANGFEELHAPSVADLLEKVT
jgi:hypothetical protein